MWNRDALILALVGLLYFAGNAAPSFTQEPAATVITVPDGTPVHLYLMDDVNSKTNKAGDAIRFKVREDVRIADIVIIPVGSAAVGHLISVGRTGLMGHSGTLGLSIEHVVGVDEAKILLRGEAKVKGGSRGATTGWSAAWFGPGAFIHKGTMMNAYVDGDQTIKLVAEETGK